MMYVLARGRLSLTVLLLAAICVVSPAGATIVRFDTSLGNIDVRLYDTATPLTVANFLDYTLDQRYDGTFVHRKALDFVVQGGGFSYDEATNSAPGVETFDPVLNEPGISNTRGTIAMAKLGGDPNSATSQWFFNVRDNGGSPPNGLDYQNGGFTAFGRVLGNGMGVVDAINALPIDDLDGQYYHTFDTVPLRDGTDLSDSLVFVNSVTVQDLPAGDYNFDSIVDEADFGVWKSSFGSITDAAADGNGDGVVDGIDYVVWRNSLPAAERLPGDYDGNGQLNEADFEKWRADFGLAVAPGTGADGNGDGIVDGIDYVWWRNHLPATGTGAVVTQAVPEPTAVMLLVTGLAVLLLRGDRRHRR